MTKPRVPAAKEGIPSERTASETTALLVEVGRAVKARTFYAAGEPEVRLLFSRAWRSVETDLKRFGALDLEAAPAWLRAPGLGLRVPNVQLGGLAQRLAERGVRTLRFEPGLESDGLAALVDLLAADPEDTPETTLAAALAARVPRGIVVNGEAPASSPRPTTAPHVARPAEEPGAQAMPAPSDGLLEPDPPGPNAKRASSPADDATTPVELLPLAVPSEPGEGDWSLATSHGGATAAAEREPPPADSPGFEISLFDATGADQTPSEVETESDLGAGALGLGIDPSDATPRTTEDTDTEAVETEHRAAALGADDVVESNDGRASELARSIRELGDCDDDFQYHDLARRTEILATALSDEGHTEAGYRTMVLFARHAGADGKRTPLQRDAAIDHLQRLARGGRLAELVDRACASDTESSLEATQVLLRLGGNVVPMLLRAVEREADPNRRGQLHGILIAMGEAALPELMRAFESGEIHAQRAAARLAGELQNPKAVPPLAVLLEGTEPPLRQEAAKALLRIGDPRALDVLVRALESPVADVPNLAAFCLGASGSGRAAEALRGALRRAVGRRRYEFATELVRALGRLGRIEAAADLAALLGHRGLRYRAQWRDLKLAAATALGRVPGDEATEALLAASRVRDSGIRRIAQAALDRRGR